MLQLQVYSLAGFSIPPLYSRPLDMLASFPGLPCLLFFGLCYTDADPLMNDLRQAQQTLADEIVYRVSGVLTSCGVSEPTQVC